MGAHLSRGWAMNLIWDSDASKLGALLSVIVGLQLIEVGTLLTLDTLTRQHPAMRMLLTMATRKRKRTVERRLYL